MSVLDISKEIAGHNASRIAVAISTISACGCLIFALVFTKDKDVKSKHSRYYHLSTDRSAVLLSPSSIAAVIVLVAPISLYIASAPTSVYLVDAGSFTLAAWLPGVAHPPGFPAYIALAWLFLQIPLPSLPSLHMGNVNDPPYKLNILSGILGAVTVALVWSIARSWILRKAFPGQQSDERSYGWHIELPAVAGALLVMVCWPVWMYSTMAEVYTLTSTCLLGAIWCVTKWSEQIVQSSQPSHYWLVCAGSLFGVAGSAHHVTAALALPGLCYVVIAHQPKAAIATRNIVLCALPALTIGLLFYCVFMYRIAQTNPIWNWGGASDWVRLYRHVIGKQYSINLFGSEFGWKSVTLESTRILWMTLFSYTPVGILLASFALCGTLLPHQIANASSTTSNNTSDGVIDHSKIRLLPERVMLLLFIVFGVLFIYVYNIAEDKEGYFMTSSWSVALAYAIGSYDLMARVTGTCHPNETAENAQASTKRGNMNTTPIQTVILSFLLLMGPLAAAIHNASRGGCYRPGDHRAKEIVEAVMGHLPKGSLLMMKEFQVYSPWLSMHHIARYRPDLTVIDILLVRRSWYMDYLREKHARKLMKSLKKEEKAYRTQLALFEDDKPYDGSVIQATYLNLVNGMIREAKRKKKAVFYLPQFGRLEEGVGQGLSWIPYGLAYKGFTPDERLNANDVHKVREACAQTLQHKPLDHSWIRHPFDIEGYKLQMLYVQSLGEQMQTWPRLLTAQKNGAFLPPVLNETEIETIQKYFESRKTVMMQNLPINAK